MHLAPYPQIASACNVGMPTICTSAEWESVRKVADMLDAQASTAPTRFMASVWRDLAASVRFEFVTAD